MQIEKIQISQLTPSDYNPRKDLKPGDPEYDKLKRSIEQFGYVEPVIWNKTTGRSSGAVKQATLEKYFDLGRMFRQYQPDELPTRYLKTYCALERMWGRDDAKTVSQ